MLDGTNYSYKYHDKQDKSSLYSGLLQAHVHHICQRKNKQKIFKNLKIRLQMIHTDQNPDKLVNDRIIFTFIDYEREGLEWPNFLVNDL